MTADKHCKLVMFVLNSYCSAEPVCWPAISTILRDTGLSRGSLYKTLDYLRRFGYLIRSRRQRRNFYTLNLDERQVHLVESSASRTSTGETPIVHQVESSHIQHISTAITAGIDSITGSNQNSEVQQVDSLEDSREEDTEESSRSLSTTLSPDPDVEDVIPLSDLEIHWAEFVADLPIPRQTYLTWFKSLQPVDLVNDTWTVIAPSNFHFNWISGHYPDILLNFNIKLTLKSIELQLESQ